MIKPPVLLLLLGICCLRALPQGRSEATAPTRAAAKGEAMKAARAALDLAKKSGQPAMIGQAYFNLSEQYAGNFTDTAIRIRYSYLDSAIAPLKAANDQQRLADSYRVMADLDHLINNIDKALKEANIALGYYRAIHFSHMQDIYVLFAKLYYLTGDYHQSLKYGLMALERAEATKDSSMRLCEIANNLGFTYFKLNETANARKYFDVSIGVAERHGDSLTVRMLASNIVECYLKLGEPEKALQFFTSITSRYVTPEDKYEMGSYASDKAWFQIYMDLTNYDKAGYYAGKLVALTTQRKLNKLILSNCYENVIRFDIATRRFAEAEDFLMKNDRLCDSLHDLVARSRNYAQWFTLDTTRGDFRLAVLHSNSLNTIKDKVFTDEKNKTLARLQVEYETDKKEKELQVQRSDLRHSNLIRDISIAGVVVFALAGGLFYRQFRQKRRAYKAEERSNNELRQLLAEKEWLLKEIHHRVKNNLQIVLSLLNSQSAYIDNEYALIAIRESQHRVHAMSLIHQRLYGSENVSSINMSRYIDELVTYLEDSFDTWRQIRFEVDVEPIELDVSQAVPLGLVLNEVITNSIKYAFPDGRNGVIGISLANTGSRHYLLTITDDGIGIPAHFQHSKPGSLGMSLIAALTGNLDGNLSIESNNGTTVKIAFTHELVVKGPRAMAAL